MKDNDEKLIFCKRCKNFKPIKGSVWDFVYSGFLCNSCYKIMLGQFNKENKE